MMFHLGKLRKDCPHVQVVYFQAWEQNNPISHLFYADNKSAVKTFDNGMDFMLIQKSVVTPSKKPNGQTFPVMSCNFANSNLACLQQVTKVMLKKEMIGGLLAQ